VGRLFLPWAPSLSTIDGGYLGRKITRLATVGFFAGSTPDASSWSYNPNQHIAGTFVNFEAGDFEHTRFYSTAGVAVTSIQWKVARQFAFFENNLSWKRYMTLYSSLQADEARTSPLPNGGSNPTGISQSYSSLHFQPFHHLGFGVNHNYFRSLPTYDPRLLGTGLLDQYLFQGFSGDVRVELVKHISVYASLGRSKATSDKKNSLNQAFGITLPNLLRTGLSPTCITRNSIARSEAANTPPFHFLRILPIRSGFSSWVDIRLSIPALRTITNPISLMPSPIGTLARAISWKAISAGIAAPT